MKLDNYEIVKCHIIPAYWFEEGDSDEHFWVDWQNLDYHKWNHIYEMSQEEANAFIDNRKYWLILPYKPKGVKVTEENEQEVVKWLVTESWHDDFHCPGYDNVDYEYYEWDFENHCVKID